MQGDDFIWRSRQGLMNLFVVVIYRVARYFTQLMATIIINMVVFQRVMAKNTKCLKYGNLRRRSGLYCVASSLPHARR